MMLLKQWIPVAALAVMHLATGQEKSSTSPFDAHVPVSALRYESAFTGYRTVQDEGTTPDQLWRQANDDMGTLGGHAGHLSRDSSKHESQAENSASSTQTGPSDHGKHH